jgi:peptidyl-prolyl cis-trans isomerase D
MITIVRARLFRNKNVITYIILAILGMAFLLPNFVRQASSYGDWMVRVNRQEISYHDYARKAYFFEQQIAAIRQHYGQYADMFLQSMGLGADAKELALKTLIDEELLNQAARAVGMHISQDYISDMLGSAQIVQQIMPDLIPAYVFDASGTINEERLGAYLKRIRLSATYFEYKIQEALSRVMLLRLLFAGAEVPQFELLERFGHTHQAKKYTVLTLSFDPIKRQEEAKSVSENELNQFYERSKDTYRVPEKRAGTTWTFAPDAYDITMNEGEIEAYYDTHKMQRFVETSAKVEVRRMLFAVKDSDEEQARAQQAAQVRSELLDDPTKFAQRAGELSDDHETARNGGLMKPFAKGVHNKVFEKTAFLLPEDGAISEVIRTDEGFEIIRRVSKTKVVFKPLNTVKKEIVAALTKQKFAQAFAHDIQELQIQGGGEQALQAFITKNAGVLDKKYDFKVRGGNDKINQALFSLEQIGDYTFFMQDDKGTVVQLSGIQPRFLPDLASIKNDVLEELYETRAHERITTILEEMRDKALHKVPLRDIASVFEADYQVTDFISSEKGADKKQQAPIKNLPKEIMLKLEKPGLIMVHQGQRDGYLIRCDEVAAFDEKLFEAQKNSLQGTILLERMRMMVGAFVASLYRDATIEISKQQASE